MSNILTPVAFKSTSLNMKICFIFIILIIGGVILLLNLFTPLNWDDYNYKFISEANDESHPLRLVTSVNDVINSQYNHYFSTNGRSICHFFVQIFSALIGKDIFNYINTSVFISFIILLTFYTLKLNPLNIFFSFSLIILLFPAFNETILWMTGSINYLWSCTGILLFLVLFQQLKSQYNKLLYVPFFLLSCIIGWSNEGVSLPFAGGLIIFLFLNRIKVNAIKFWLIAGFLIGSFVCSFAPSTINRSEVNQNSIGYLLLHKGEAFFIVLSKLRAVYLFIFFFILKYFTEFQEKKAFLFNFFKDNSILIGALGFSFFIILLAGQTETRSAVGVEFFSIILILRLFPFKKAVFNNLCKLIFSMISIVFIPFILNYSFENYKNFKSVEDQLKNTNNEIILYNNLKIPYIFQRYILVPRSYNFISNKMSNKALNIFYDRSKVIFLPKNIFKDIIDGNNIIKDIMLQKNYKFYVIPLNETVYKGSPYYELNLIEDKNIPLLLRPFKDKLDRFSASEIPASDFQIIKIKDKNFMLVGRNEIVDNRVNKIIIK